MKRRISHSDISKAFSADPTALLTQLGELNVAAQPISRLVADDGDARKAATPLSTTSLSIAGQVIEQKSGLPPRRCDGEVDVFAHLYTSKKSSAKRNRFGTDE